eukprot:253168_1
MVYFILYLSIMTFCDSAFHQQLISNDGSVGDQLYGYSVAVFNHTAIIGARGDNSLQGVVYVFKKDLDSGEWTQKQKLIADDATMLDRFGHSIAMDSYDQIIIGAYGVDTAKGAAYIFEKLNGNWTQKIKLIPRNVSFDDWCALSVAIKDDIALIGCFRDDEIEVNSGAVYVFQKINNEWIETQKLKANDAGENNFFGFSISIYDDVAVIGAYGHSKIYGSVYIFEYNSHNGEWTETQKLTASDREIYNVFGRTVSIYQKTIIIGAIGADNWKGKVYVFGKNEDKWIEQKILSPTEGNENKYFGVSVCIYDQNIVVGSGTWINSGSVYVYEQIGDDWIEKYKLQPVEDTNQTKSERTVSIWENVLIVGLGYDDTEINDAGSAFIYERIDENAEWIPTQNPTVSPTNTPSDYPTFSPSNSPSRYPTTNWETLYSSYVNIVYNISGLNDVNIDQFENNAILMMP